MDVAKHIIDGSNIPVETREALALMKSPDKYQDYKDFRNVTYGGIEKEKKVEKKVEKNVEKKVEKPPEKKEEMMEGEEAPKIAPWLQKFLK